MALLNILVSELVMFFSIGSPMGATEVKAAVQSIIHSFWMLKPDDFKLCFEMAKKGEFGPVYNRVDGNVILTWLAKYTELRTKQAIENNEAEHAKYKAESNNSILDRKQISDAEKSKYAEAVRLHMINNAKKV